MENSTTIAVDLSKTFFQISISTVPGRVNERARLTRQKFVSFLATRPPSEIVMEACGSAHFWARTARELGHQPVLLPAHYTKKYVLRDKHDRADADAILEARRREAIRPTPAERVDDGFGRTDAGTSRQHFRPFEGRCNDWLPACGSHLGPGCNVSPTPRP